MNMTVTCPTPPHPTASPSENPRPLGYIYIPNIDTLSPKCHRTKDHWLRHRSFLGRRGPPGFPPGRGAVFAAEAIPARFGWEETCGIAQDCMGLKMSHWQSHYIGSYDSYVFICDVCVTCQGPTGRDVKDMLPFQIGFHRILQPSGTALTST